MRKNGDVINWSLLACVLLFLYLPLVPPILFSISEGGSSNALRELTLRWYLRLWDNPVLMGSLRTTVILGLITAGITPVLGLLAAMAVPALMLTRDDEKGTQTSRQIELLATACEAFAGDTQTYPPAEGWVPVERITPYLEPLYGSALPRIDVWENPFLYWSDGRSFRILSTGEDGEMDRDWSGVEAPRPPAETGGDIVYGDGQFLATP